MMNDHGKLENSLLRPVSRMRKVFWLVIKIINWMNSENMKILSVKMIFRRYKVPERAFR